MKNSIVAGLMQAMLLNESDFFHPSRRKKKAQRPKNKPTTEDLKRIEAAKNKRARRAAKRSN